MTTSCRAECRRMSCGILELLGMRKFKFRVIASRASLLPFPSCEKLIERSLIWSLLGRMSRHGLLPIPIDCISVMRISIWRVKQRHLLERKALRNNDASLPRFLFACFHNSVEISSAQVFLISSFMLCRVHVSPGFRFRNQISNFVGESPT